jgi:hypothetical protein
MQLLLGAMSSAFVPLTAQFLCEFNKDSIALVTELMPS